MRRSRHSPSRSGLVRSLIDVCRRLGDRAFVAATDGNVSVRLESGNVLITRAGIPKGLVTGRDLVEVTAEGKTVGRSGRPSTELAMHLFVYRERSDVHAIVHAHPPVATGFAAARVPLDANLFPEVVLGFGAIPLAEYATPSTQEVAASIAPFVRRTEAILLANHGVVTFGSDPMDAYLKMEKVEQTAQSTLVARFLGGGIPLSGKELERLKGAATAVDRSSSGRARRSRR